MKKYLPYIIIAVAAILVYNIIFSRYDIKTDIEKYKQEIEALERKVDSLHAENDILQFEADSLEAKMDEYDVRIKNLNYTINVIKKETQQKLDAVDLFGDDELERFFSNRYRQHTDSIN